MERTICHYFVENSEKYAQRTAVTYNTQRGWVTRTWKDYFQTVEATALGLTELGIGTGDFVAIFSNTRFEWAVCDMAILGLGAITVPIYQSSTAEDLAYIINDSKVRILICEDVQLVERFQQVANQCPTVEKIICISGEAKSPALSWQDLQKMGCESSHANSSFLKTKCLEHQLDQIATVVYTSGTTGVPKGVVITHTQIVSEVVDTFNMVSVRPEDCTLSFLPYAHILGRVEMWGQIYSAYSMGFARSMETIRDDMLVVRPTILVAVPRLFEKIYAGILAQVETSQLKKKIFDWSLEVGRVISLAEIQCRPAGFMDLMRFQLAKKLVFNTLHQKMGGRLRFCVSGGGPLSREIAEFFHAAGILVLEGYGLTETTAAITVNTPFDFKFGTVGKPIGDVKLKIADDGEILAKSKKNMREYFKNPQATQETLTDGWLHTGDIGELTPEGFLRITDRKKELIKTAGGKYIAPQKIEGLLNLNQYISQSMVYGDRKKYVVVLVTLDPNAVQRFAKASGLSGDMKTLCHDAKVRELVREAVAEVNAHLASYETVKNFAIVDKEFSVEGGELTPSLKIKRKVVSQRYEQALEALYN